MAIFPNVYVAMVMISSMGIISMSISYCPYALLGQYHEIKEVCTHTSMHMVRAWRYAIKHDWSMYVAHKQINKLTSFIDVAM